MYIGSLDPVSNRATWAAVIEVVDDATGQPYDISDASDIRMQLRTKGGGLALSGSMSGGEIEIVGTSSFRWTFPPETMGTVCAGTYDAGLIIEFPTGTSQIFIATAAILEGIVR